jgi:hemoglobin/transferrin/lactoferrin receptor protein
MTSLHYPHKVIFFALSLVSDLGLAADIPKIIADGPIVELEPVVVTAAPVKNKLLALPGTRSVIDSGTIERRLMRSIKDLVRYEPGVEVSNDPQRFGMGGFNIRGIGGNRIQMLVDGIRAPEAFSIGTFQSAGRNSVDVDALKAVDIVRGANSAVNGSDGIAGTVSFVTKDPEDYLAVFGNKHYESLKLRYGSVNDNFAQTLTLAGRQDQWDGLLLFTHAAGAETDNQGTNASKTSARTAPNPQETQTFNLLSKLLYHVNDDNSLRLTGEAFQNDADTEALHLYGSSWTGRQTQQFLTDDAQSRWRISLDQTLDNVGWRWLDSAKWRIYGQVSDTEQNVDEQRDTPFFKLREQLKRQFTYTQSMLGGGAQGSTQFEWASMQHHLRYGAEMLGTDIEALRNGSLTDLDSGKVSNKITPDSFPVRDFPLTTTLRGGLFLQDEISLWDSQLKLIPALRLDYFGIRPTVDSIYNLKVTSAKDNPDNNPNALDFFEPSPKLGVLWQLDDTFTLHGQYAEGFRAPNFSESNLGFVNYTFGYASIPNLNLRPETSYGGELGFRAEGRAGSFDATVFRTLYQGFIQSATTCDPVKNPNCNNGLLTYQTQNTLDEVQIQGLEFKLETRLGAITPLLQGFNLQGSFAYTEGENLGKNLPISSVAPMKGVLGLRYDAPKGNWGAEAIMTLAAAKEKEDIDFAVSGDVFPVSGYGLVDLNGYYRLGEHVTLNAGLFNLLDKKYTQWQDVTSRSGDPHAALGAPVDIRDRYTQVGRNVGVSLRVEF